MYRFTRSLSNDSKTYCALLEDTSQSRQLAVMPCHLHASNETKDKANDEFYAFIAIFRELFRIHESEP